MHTLYASILLDDEWIEFRTVRMKAGPNALTTSSFEVEQFVVVFIFWQVAGIGVLREQMIANTILVSVSPPTDGTFNRVLILGTREP